MRTWKHGTVKIKIRFYFTLICNFTELHICIFSFMLLINQNLFYLRQPILSSQLSQIHYWKLEDIRVYEKSDIYPELQESPIFHSISLAVKVVQHNTDCVSDSDWWLSWCIPSCLLSPGTETTRVVLQMMSMERRLMMKRERKKRRKTRKQRNVNRFLVTCMSWSFPESSN